MSSNVLKSADFDLHRVLFEKAPLPLLLLHGPSLSICMANEKASQLFGKPPVALYLHQLFDSTDLASITRLLEKKSEKAVVSLLKKDTLLTLDIFCSALPVDDETYYQIHLVDVTECQ